MLLELPFPPSINGYWRAYRRGSHCTQIISQKGRDYREEVISLLQSHTEPLRGRLMVKIDLYPPDSVNGMLIITRKGYLMLLLMLRYGRMMN